MLTRNATQAFRYILATLLIGCIFPTWSAAQQNKIDASVLEALQT